jgi:hypothetical protein
MSTAKYDVSIVDILEKCPAQSAFSDEGKWDLMSMIDALQRNYLDGFGDSDNELISQIALRAGPDAVWGIHTIFNIDHDSDESCSAQMLVIDGSPALLMKRIGDRSDYSDGLSILNVELAKKLIHTINDYYVELKLKQMDGRISQDLIVSAEDVMSSCQYITPVKGDVFVVNSPKWVMGFQHLFKSHSAWVVDDSGVLNRVIQFKRFTNDLPSWADRSQNIDPNEAIVLIGSKEVLIDTREILFTLTKEPLSMDALQASAAIVLADKQAQAHERTNLAAAHRA